MEKDRRLGQILLLNKKITQEQLDKALQIKNNEKNMLLGEALLQVGVYQKDIDESLDLYNKRKSIGQIFLSQKIISEQQLDEALEIQKKSHNLLGEILLEMGYISYQDYISIISKHFNLPIISLTEFKGDISFQIIIGDVFALKNRIVVIEDKNDVIKLAVSDPSKNLLKQLYRFMPKHKKLKIYIAIPDEIKNILENIYPSDLFQKHFSNNNNLSKILIDSNTSDFKEIILHDFQVNTNEKSEKNQQSNIEKSDSLRMSLDNIIGAEINDDENITVDDEVDDSTSIDKESNIVAVQYVNQIIKKSRELNASDIHFEPTNKDTNIRMRIDGICHNIAKIPDKYTKALISRLKIMANLNIAEKRKPQDGKIKVKFSNQELELRIATMPTVYGESAVIRLLSSGRVLGFDKLNFITRDEKEIRKIISQPYGIMLVVGPTGSGKTTTLHTLLSEINTPERKIWTAEDPVEITQTGLQQVQINHSIGLNFSAVLRSFLRLDPDVILIGEMRDFETANIGIEASLTGHLVFSTLHTNSASATIIRLLDIGVDPFSFSDSLLGILAQRLVRVLCSECKKTYHPEIREIEELIKLYGEKLFQDNNLKKENIQLFKHGTCKTCNNTGYKGRTGIHELLVSSNEIKKIVSMKGSVDEILHQSVKEGMITMLQNGIIKIMTGITDLKELKNVAFT
ncbi:MAG: Flp pilus assembly complex ATPase component TadA [Desulfobacterales bacterium]|nr:Flp pilus assembly complex ATPase component TadA [Desulfobacterales bacterium]